MNLTVWSVTALAGRLWCGYACPQSVWFTLFIDIEEWIEVDDPVSGQAARRESNTMPQWAGSCWYYLRYCDPRNKDRFIGGEAERYWSGQGENVAGASSPVAENRAKLGHGPGRPGHRSGTFRDRTPESLRTEA